MTCTEVEDVECCEAEYQHPENVVDVGLGTSSLQQHHSDGNSELRRAANPCQQGAGTWRQACYEDGSEQSIHAWRLQRGRPAC